MVTEKREPADNLNVVRALLARAHTTQFLALVPLLERLTPDAARVGGDGPPSREALRFLHDPSMGFAAGDVTSAELSDAPIPREDWSAKRTTLMKLTTTFLGLTGAISPLPLYIPAEVAQENAGQNVQAAFLDVFHHRLISLFYRLWTRYDYAREYTSDGQDVWSKRVYTLVASETATRDQPTLLPRHKLLRLAPLLTTRNRSSRSLVLALQEMLDLPQGHVGLVQFVGGYVPLDSEQRMRLARSTAVLGRTAILGAQAYERGSKFRLVLGPMAATEYPAYVERGARIELLRQTVELMLREPLDYDVELVLGEGAAPGFALTAHRGARLGIATRLRSSGARQSVLIRNAGRRVNPRPV